MSAEKLTILISPTHRCNMQCDYCYVSETRHGDMSLGDFKAAYSWIIEYCRYLSVNFVDFTWFGGEPLLFGEGNLELALQEQARYFKKTGIQYVNRMQSNLTLVDAWTCRLVKDYFGGFIGGSFEPFGTARKFRDGMIATGDVERKIDYLCNMGVRIGIVSTLTKKDLRPPVELYEWFKQHVEGFRINRAHSPNGLNIENYLTVDEYNDYIIELFDLYTNDDTPKFQFANFAAIARSILLKRPFVCIDSLEPEWKLSIAGDGEIASYCRKNDIVLGNYYTSKPCEVIEAYKRLSHPEWMPMSCRKCNSYIKKVCSGACLGEPDKDCLGATCGYRSEYTKETFAYVQQYLQSKGIGSIKDCCLHLASKIL